MTHENLTKKPVPKSKQVTRRTWLRQVINVVSEMSLGDISSAESFIHKANDAQMPGDELALGTLKYNVGRPVDTFTRSGPIDLEPWDKKVGESFRSQDGTTFVYSRMVEDRGSERVIKTAVFTSIPRPQIISSLGEPERPQENNVIPFPTQEELEPAA